jgi:hypothetical protein
MILFSLVPAKGLTSAVAGLSEIPLVINLISSLDKKNQKLYNATGCINNGECVRK